MLEIEAKTLPMEATTNNIGMLEKMLHNLRKAQQELNIGEGVSVVTEESQTKLKELVGGFQSSGETMIQATHKLLELAEERSLLLKIDEEGKYSISTPTSVEAEVEVETVKINN